MEQGTVVPGKTINITVTENRLGRMVRSTKAITSMGKKKAKDYTDGMMAQRIMEIGQTTRFTDPAFTLGWTGECTRANGEIIKCMVLA